MLLKEKLIEVTMKNLEVVFLQKCSHPDCGVYLQEYDTNHMEYDVTPELLRISDAEQKRQAYFSILESIPYCPIIYKTLLLEYGDSQKELQILARDYGIDLDRIKKDLLRKEAAKLSKDNGNIIEQMSELERKYSYYDGQLEQEIHKKYLERFIADNDVDYLSETEVGKRIKFLNEFSKQYQCNIDMYLRNIKECILMAYHIDLSCEKSLQELETLKEKIMHLSITYELNFDEYITVIQNKISKASLEIEKEEKEKRTVYDVSDITMQQGIIKKRKVILDSQEEAQNVQKRIDEICGLFDAMNFEMCDKKLFEQFSNLQEKASEFPYCEKVIALVKTKQSQMKLEADSSKADMPSDGVKEENKNSCLSCGVIIKEFYRFCPKCGKSLIINSDTEENVSKESVPEDVIHYENQKIVDEHNVKEDIDLDNKTEKKQIGVQDIIDYTKSGGFKSEGCKKSFDELCTCLNDNETVTSILGYLNTLSQNYKECATQVANKTLMDKIINGGVSRYFGMDEKALFYKDSAILFLGKEGTLITNKAIYRIKKSGVCKILLSELESINLIDIVNGSNENNACRWCFNHNKDFNLDAVGTNAPQQAGIIIALICLLFIEINPDRKLKFFNFI